MLQMNQNYEPEFKKKIVRLHLEEVRSLRGLAAEYRVSMASISNLSALLSYKKRTLYRSGRICIYTLHLCTSAFL